MERLNNAKNQLARALRLLHLPRAQDSEFLSPQGLAAYERSKESPTADGRPGNEHPNAEDDQ